MPIQSTYCRIYVDEFNFAGESNAFQLTADAQAIEYNVFQDPATQSIPDNPAVKLTHNGYFNDTAGRLIEKELYDRLGVDSVVAVTLGTDQAVPVGYVLPSTYNGQLTIEAKTNQLITVQGLWPIKTGQLYRGYQLLAATLISATGAQPGIDFGSAGASGGYAWLFVHNITGTASGAQIRIQHDDNSGFSSPSTAGTFTFSSKNAYQITLSAVDRYMRINTISLGGATSFNVSVIAASTGVTM